MIDFQSIHSCSIHIGFHRAVHTEELMNNRLCPSQGIVLHIEISHKQQEYLSDSIWPIKRLKKE